MEFKFSKDQIELKKNLTNLDKFVIDFTSILNKQNIGYVIISGYIPILFGRSRASEDIDIIMEKINFPKFQILWEEITKRFECIIAKDAKNAYKEYLLKKESIRFAKKHKFIPNIEIKFPKIELDTWTLKQKIKVFFNNHSLFISPIELQIPFKLFLGTEKDIEDARYLYKIFKNKINLQLLYKFNRKLKIEDLFNKYIR